MLTVARLKYILVGLFAANWFVSGFLTSLTPTVAYWIPWICLACWIPLFCVFLGALFRRSWKGAAIVLTALLLDVFCFAKPQSVESLRFWFFAKGFRIHAFPAKDYLSGCHLTEFVEDGVKQTVGTRESWGAGYEYTDYFAFYDTTGEIALPLSQRTPEWKDAMWHHPPKRALRDSADRAAHLFGSFYRVTVYDNEFDGDSAQ